ncbi:MAG: hypothetical protein ABEJ72_08740, partial [Candidatus Aenigmatarchaeota archaeon]
MPGVNLSSIPGNTESFDASSKSSETHQSSPVLEGSSWSESPYPVVRQEGCWINGGGAMTVENIEGLDTEPDYVLKYREGRFNPSIVEGGEFDERERAMEFAQGIVNGDWQLDPDPVWHRSKLCLERDGYSINVYETDKDDMDRLVLTETGRYGTEELKSGYFENSGHV